jgi:hypothetical protein
MKFAVHYVLLIIRSNLVLQVLLIGIVANFRNFESITYQLKFVLVPLKIRHVEWVPCHHGMARPLIVDGLDGLHMWKVATNILNKQSRTADTGCSSSLGGFGVGLTTH